MVAAPFPPGPRRAPACAHLEGSSTPKAPRRGPREGRRLTDDGSAYYGATYLVWPHLRRYVDEYYEKLGDWGGVTGYLRTGPRADALTRGEPLHMLVAIKVGGGRDGGRGGGGRDAGT